MPRARLRLVRVACAASELYCSTLKHRLNGPRAQQEKYTRTHAHTQATAAGGVLRVTLPKSHAPPEHVHEVPVS